MGIGLHYRKARDYSALYVGGAAGEEEFVTMIGTASFSKAGGEVLWQMLC
jgi:hypothetical protein